MKKAVSRFDKGLLADAGLFYCAAVWGATFYMVKDALAAVHPVTLVAYRFLLSAALMLPWVFARPRIGALLKEGAILSVWLTALYISQTVGLGYTTASNSGFITGLFILFVPVFMYLFFKQKPNAGQWAAVGLAVCGLWLLTGGLHAINLGDALTLVAAVSYAAHLLAVDRYVKADADTVLLAFHQFWMTGLASLLWSLTGGYSLEVENVKTWGVIVFLALFPTLSAFFIQMLAQKLSTAVKVALIFSLEPVFAAVFAWTVGGEPVRPASIWGGGLIVLAMVVGELSKLSIARLRGKEPVAA